MKVGEDVVLESSRDELGQKSTEAGEGSKIIVSYIWCYISKRIDVLYVSKYTYLLFSIQCRDIE